MRSPQLKLFKTESKAYGGILLKTRKGRSTPRPISTRHTMHLVLRSSKATGAMSFRAPKNRRRVAEIVNKFTTKYAVKVISFANVGNHLHFHLKFANRQTYRPFIRAMTAAIAMAITGRNRWTHTKLDENQAKKRKGAMGSYPWKFWDYRPFTRIVIGLRDLLGITDYLRINQLEGLGFPPDAAKVVRKFELVGVGSG